MEVSESGAREVGREGWGSEAHVPPGGKEAQPPAASPHRVSPSEQRTPQKKTALVASARDLVFYLQ